MAKRLDVQALREALPGIEELRRSKAIPAEATSSGPPRPASPVPPSESAWREIQSSRERREAAKATAPLWRPDFKPALPVSTHFPPRARRPFADATTDQVASVSRAATRLAEGNVVALVGSPGQGKTTMAHWLAEMGQCPTMYIRASDLFSAWKSWYTSEYQNHNKRLLRTCPFMVIDDPQNVQRRVDGGRGLTEAELECITWVIDHRYGDRLPTLILANFTGDGLENWAGPAVADRIMEGGFIECGWGSFRGAGEKDVQ